MSMKTRLISFLQASVVATLALTVPMVASADDDPDLTVYKEGKVPLKKPAMRLRPLQEYTVQGQLFDFPTGLRIFMQPDNTHPIITVHSITDHGSGSDPEGKGGLAHFTEHTWFKSQHDYLDPVTREPRPDVFPSLKIMDMQSYIGATMNAYTKADTTEYMTTASGEFKNLLMQYESWRLAEPYRNIEQSEISVEVNVILNEWRRRNEQDQALVFDYMFQAVYPEGHPYTGRSTKETLESITLKDLQGFFDKNYTTENTTIVVVGDFDPIQASSMIFGNFDWKLLDPRLDPELDRWVARKPGIPETEFDKNNPDHFIVGAFDPTTRDLPKSERPRYSYVDAKTIEPRVQADTDPEPPPKANREVLVRKAPVAKDTVVVGWPLPGGFRSDDLDMRMMGFLASITVNWEMQGLYKARGEVVPYPDMDFKYCTTFAAEVNSTILCRATFDPKVRDAEDAADKIVNQLQRIWDPNFKVQLNNLFDNTRSQFMMDTLFNVDEVATPFDGRAATVAEHLHFTGNPKVHSTRIADMSSINVDNLATMAEKYMRRDSYGILHMQPLATRERDTKSNGSAYAGAADEDNLIDKSLEDTSGYTPKKIADSWVKPHLEGIEEFKLDNGLRVVVHQHGTAPIVSAMLMVGGGTSMTPSELYSYFKRNTRSDYLDVLPIGAEERDVIGNDVNGRPVELTNHQVRSVKVLSGNLDGGIFALRHWADTLHPELGNVPKYVRDGKKALKKRWNSEGWHAAGVRNAQLYPNHEFGKRQTLSDWDEYAKWGRLKVGEMIKDRVRPDNSVLVLVGNVEKEDMKKVAYEMFSSWGSSGSLKPIDRVGDPDMPTAAPRVVLTNNPRVTQSTIRTACRLNYAGPEDDQAMELLSTIVKDDVFGTLRVKEGLGYSPGGYAYSPTDNSGVLLFYALATNAGVGRVVEYFEEWVADKQANGFSEERVRTFQMRLARESGVLAQSTDQMLLKLGQIIDEDQTWEEYMATGAEIAAVQPADMQRLLEGCGDHLVTTIQGPKDVIEPLLVEKGIAYEELEWKNARDDIYMEQDPKGFTKFVKGEVKDNKKKKKTFTKACDKDPEARECVLLEELIEDMEEEAERKAARKAAE